MKRILLPLLVVFLLVTAVFLPAKAAHVLEEEGDRIAAAADAITFSGGQQTAVCPVCLKSVNWKPLKTSDLSGGITLAKATHYYLAEDIEATDVSITGPGSASHISCLHLNGKKLIRTDGVVISGGAGTLNIMGQGQVKGAGNQGATYAATVQINTGGACHLESAMLKRAIDVLDLERLDLIIIENVGNLVCPTDFDLGENAKIMILSVPEGDDKPLKYPGVFQVAEAVILNKVDTMPVFDFDREAFDTAVRNLNPKAPIFPIAATKGTGVEEWASWLADRIRQA